MPFSPYIAIVDSTAHAMKFSGFQEKYFEQSFPSEFKISSNPELINAPVYIHPESLARVPAPGKPLQGDDFHRFVEQTSKEIAKHLSLKKVPKE